MTRRYHNPGRRLGRYGKPNPGRRHLAGADVSEKMERQYEHVLASLRQHGRYRSDAKRKQVAAATVRKLAQQNPSALSRLGSALGLGLDEESRAQLLTEDFHGRPVRDVIEVEEREVYDRHVAVLGYLIELGILMEDEETDIPIRFQDDDDDPVIDDSTVYVVSNPAGTNIQFVGGDQDIDWQSVDGASQQGKYLVWVGPVHSIAYFTDKHHLSGPKSQKDGTPYEHEFGEEGGELPCLIFDRQNKRILLVGGDYSVEPEGIAG